MLPTLVGVQSGQWTRIKFCWHTFEQRCHGGDLAAGGVVALWNFGRATARSWRKLKNIIAHCSPGAECWFHRGVSEGIIWYTSKIEHKDLILKLTLVEEAFKCRLSNYTLQWRRRRLVLLWAPGNWDRFEEASGKWKVQTKLNMLFTFTAYG